MSMPTNNLPIQLSSFIGREREIAEVRRLFTTARLVTLTGAGGCGKTRLALQVAEALLACTEPSDRWVDRVSLVPLAALSDGALVAQAIASALGVLGQSSQPLADTLVDYLRDKHTLLLLDNCEQLVEACADLTTLLLQHCPDLHILATSRQALNIAGEVVWPVPSLTLPSSEFKIHPEQNRGFLSTESAPSASLQHSVLQTEDLLASDAVQLFVARASAVVPDFKLTHQNAAAVAHICWRLDGIPLAIELAAVRVNVLSVEQIAMRLDDALHLLTAGKRSAPPRQQTLRATMDWSHAQLTGQEQVLFRRLSVFAVGCTLHAAEVIAAGDGVELDDVFELVTQLVNKSLLMKQDQDGEARYSLLEPVRQYAREHLLAAGEAELFSRRHLDFYTQLAEQAEPDLVGSEQMVWLKRLDTERDNLRAAIIWARAGGAVPMGLRLVCALRWYWIWRGYWHESSEYLSDLLARPRAQSTTEQLTALRARALLTMGQLLHHLGQSESAEPLLAEAITLAQAADEPATIADALLVRSLVAYRRRAPAASRTYVDESLTRSRAIGDADLTARILCERGWLLWVGGEVNQARADLEEALALNRTLGNRFNISRCLSNLGIIAFNQGDYGASRVLNEESLRLARELGDKNQTAVALHRIATISAAEGDDEGGRALCEQAFTLYRELGNRSLLPQVLWILSTILRQMGNNSEARRVAQESLRIARQIGFGLQVAHALANLGKLDLARGDFVTARARFEESLLIRQQDGNRLDMPTALHDLGDLAFCQEEFALARDYYEKSLSISRELGSQVSISTAERMLGYIAVYLDDLTRAAQYIREGLALNRQQTFRLGMIRYLPAVAALVLARNNVKRATRLLSAADALLEAMHVRLEPADAMAYRRSLDSARVRLDTLVGSAQSQAIFTAAWSEGRAMLLEQAIVDAEDVISEPVGSPTTSGAWRDPNALTQREVEVLRLLAQRMTDAEIAAELFISPRTVNTHLTAIYGKLGVNSRRAATEYVLGHKLI